MKNRKEMVKGANGSLVSEIKAYKRSGSLVPLILSLEIIWRSKVKIPPWQLYSSKRIPDALNRNL
jgi:hypothetical protein